MSYINRYWQNLLLISFLFSFISEVSAYIICRYVSLAVCLCFFWQLVVGSFCKSQTFLQFVLYLVSFQEDNPLFLCTSVVDNYLVLPYDGIVFRSKRYIALRILLYFIGVALARTTAGQKEKKIMCRGKIKRRKLH